eukprot:TRINITY_DN16595_c0_g1_i4.p1 TRINITY_DN16595_c0_g1~~TRINITY_DN16595_c0_g1_i4.p1  ORF type:complete len:396 (+),score=52.64 TRINITY_DN16595_c0_g1_i4:28-1188(+)
MSAAGDDLASEVAATSEPDRQSNLPSGPTEAVTVSTPFQHASLPFNPPEAVQKWLKREDWEAEAQALQWAESDMEGMDEEFWQEQGSFASSASSPSWQQGQGYSPGGQRRRPRKRPDWDQDFNLLGNDSRKPAPLRRYFDPIPAEIGPPTEAIRPGLRPKKDVERGADHDRYEALMGRGWLGWHEQVASVDNDGVHPFLRHYFDRRGLEASYRQRPHMDHSWLQKMKPRTPGRPSTRERLAKILRGSSEPSLPSIGGAPEPPKSIHWGTRCLTYGPDTQVRQGPNGERLPWVYDHHRSEAEDNEGLNPLLRHYFDKDGLESSFRQRGRAYGRRVKSVFGREFSDPPPPKASQSLMSATTATGGMSVGMSSKASLQDCDSRSSLTRH